MNSELDREDQALDALIAAAFRQEDSGDLDMEALKKAKRFLTAEDRQVLEKLGDDFVERVMNGTRESKATSIWKESETLHDEELASAMNRGDEDDLTDAAREEMERKLRELEDADDKGAEEQ
ncbi:MAG: hypothetical protein H6824_03415 [Planctomycetaceae bacterium]|nr:hypothetical protein [Planctomycetaceae bacterium]